MTEQTTDTDTVADEGEHPAGDVPATPVRSDDIAPYSTGSRPLARRRGPGRTFAAVAILAVVIFVVGAVAIYAFSRVSNRGPLVDVPAGQHVTVVVPQGADTGQIGQLLAEKGVVANPRDFRNRVRDAGVGDSLQAGTYELTTGMGYEAAIASLTAGPGAGTVKVTIPEGFTVEQIAARMDKQAGVPAAEFLALAKGGAAQFAAAHPYLKHAYAGSLEGFLFPKTYEIKPGTSTADVIEMMLHQFDEEVATVKMAKAKRAGLTMPEVVVMASLIEREAKLAKDRPIVASVIYNRLRLKWRLGIDASIQYVMPVKRSHLTLKDLEINSPYNTYRHHGLPPGPITNPGLTSLKAAANPADSRYLYWVLASKDGSLTFARTTEEFARAKAKSKKVLGN